MFKQCFMCQRIFSKEEFRVLYLHGFHDFWEHFFLELRICKCATLISFEHDSRSFDPKWLETILKPRQIALQSNKGSGRGQ